MGFKPVELPLRFRRNDGRLADIMNPRTFVPVVHAATEGRADEADTLESALGISEALQTLGYQSELIRVDLDLTPFLDLARRKPLVVFNLVEAIEADVRMAPFALAAMERMGLSCTGSRFDAMVTALSKLRCKQMLKSAGIATPAWTDGRIPLPPTSTVIVKSDSEHASIGIDAASVVSGFEAARTIKERQRRFGGRFFAETFIPGREFNVAMLDGPGGVDVLPIPEIVFEDYPDDKPRIVDFEAKWAPDSFAYNKTPRLFGLEKTDPKLARKLKRVALECWYLFDIGGYGRIDVRVDANGKPWVIDINTNPCITPEAGFACTAAEAGISYTELIERITLSGLPAEAPRPEAEMAGPGLTEIEIRPAT
jgi:D-alanine-D-alanine ligase